MIARADAPARALPVVAPAASGAEGGCASTGGSCGCHGGAERLLQAERGERAAVLDQLRRDYPLGPHDQPQGMCPAFGSLRVGLRMHRTATVLSGSACCVYGLTFTSHFYGARRTVGYVPFNSETLVTGQLFEDIRRALTDLADPERYDTIVMTNLCIPTASGVPLDRLPDQINGVRIIGIDVPGFGVPTHAEAKDVLAGALLRYARREAEHGPVPRPANLVTDRPTVTLLGELFPADPIGIQHLLDPLDVAVGCTVPPREWRELYKALDCAVAAAIHPFYVASVRELEAAGRPVVGSGPVGVDGTAAWLRAIGDRTGTASRFIDEAVDKATRETRAALDRFPLRGRISLSGYEGSELLVARLLVESGAEVPYVGTALPRTPWSAADAEWLEAHGCHVQFRASLEQDVVAFRDLNPDLVVGTTPVVQAAKEAGIPALYFTNLISARPIFGVAGAGSLASTLQGALASREPLQRMRAFFSGVGTGHAVGYGWRDVPQKPLAARERHARARRPDSGADTDTRARVERSARAKGSLRTSDSTAPGEDA
ncbi:MAG: chlorophyllide a reductase subunit Y [Gemmatimonadota bacterium]